MTGHFLLSSGLHSSHYFQCARVLQYPQYAEELCAHIAHHFSKKEPDLIIAPAIGGIVVAQEVARQLGVRSLFAERERGEMALRRGFDIQPDERVLVVEDVVTTGGSIGEVLGLAKMLGGETVGAACIVDRSGGKTNLGVEFFSLLRLRIQALPPEKCDLCKQGLPLVKPGSRKLASNG